MSNKAILKRLEDPTRSPDKKDTTDAAAEIRRLTERLEATRKSRETEFAHFENREKRLGRALTNTNLH